MRWVGVVIRESVVQADNFWWVSATLVSGRAKEKINFYVVTDSSSYHARVRGCYSVQLQLSVTFFSVFCCLVLTKLVPVARNLCQTQCCDQLNHGQHADHLPRLPLGCQGLLVSLGRPSFPRQMSYIRRCLPGSRQSAVDSRPRSVDPCGNFSMSSLGV